MERSVRVLAVVGRNPAPVAQLLWVLAAVRGERVAQVHCVVLGPRAEQHLREELLQPGAALDQMRAVVGVRLPFRVELEVAEGDAGARCWRMAQEFTRHREPVRFAAFPGRHRRQGLELATCFNFLGRQRDELLDVDVNVRGGEGMTGFYFPGQAVQVVQTREGSRHTAQSLTLEVLPVAAPRLRRLLPSLTEAPWEMVSVLGQRAVDGLSAPELTLDLEAGTARVGAVPLQLAPLPLVWLAALARARVEGDADGWIYSDSTAELAKVLVRCAHQPWVTTSRTRVLKRLVQQGPGKVTDAKSRQFLSRVRHLVKEKLQRLARKHFPVHEQVLVPEVGQTHSAGGPDHRQRLPLPPECIHLHGL
ncbi:MAG: hypothetical protein FJ086_11360 [Deltaproteobacteria bacterium]|nr:hypothetical protein [Deltaproteobacteria bacterium]